MLIMLVRTECDNVRIIKIVLNLHDVIVDSRLFSLNINSLFYLKLEARTDVIFNMKTVF